MHDRYFVATTPRVLVLASAKGAIDRTKYGRTRVSPKSFYTHHTQRLVKAAVMEDAKNIRKQVNCHRQWLHHGAAA